MEGFNIIEENDNRLFHRKEISFELTANSAPSRLETLKFLSEKLSVKPENVKIKLIDGKFGSHKFHGKVFVYDSEEKKNLIENKRKKDEKLREALSAPREEPKEEVKEEVAEEPKEEPAEEVKESEEKKE